VQIVNLGDPVANPATGVLSANLSLLLPPEAYTQLQTTEILDQPPFGAVLSLANIAYQALYVDQQGAFPIVGTMWAAVRQDGFVMIIQAEAPTVEQITLENWRPLVDGAFNSFGFPNG